MHEARFLEMSLAGEIWPVRHRAPLQLHDAIVDFLTLLPDLLIHDAIYGAGRNSQTAPAHSSLRT